jgi:hypothetical protein
MDTHNTPVPVKPSASGAGSRPAPRCGRKSPPGSRTVPIGFRVSACRSPTLLGRLRSAAGAGRGDTLLEPYATSGPERVPTKFRRSDVKVRAVERLCAGVVERPPDPAYPMRPAPRPEGGPAGTTLRVGLQTPRFHHAAAGRSQRAPGTCVVPTRRRRGVPSLSIEPTTADVQSIHRLAASRPPRATATSPPAAGSGTERRSATRPAPRFVTRAERAISTAPTPGTS